MFDYIILASVLLLSGLLFYLISLIKKSINTQGSEDEETAEDDNRLTEMVLSIKEIKDDVKNFKSPMEKLQTFMAGSAEVGSFAEWNLGSIIKDFLPSEMYVERWRPDETNRANVEFAIKLENNLFLPIDSKVPYTSYTNYLSALKQGDRNAAEIHKSEIRTFVIDEAKKITKYIVEGRTPNLAYMYIPSEDCLRIILSLKHDATDKSLPEYFASLERKVLIVGPNLLATELSILLANQQRIIISERADHVLAALHDVENEFIQLKSNANSIKSNAQTLSNNIDKQTTRVNQMGKSIDRMKQLSNEDAND